MRDHLDEDVEAVITDNKETEHEIYKFVKKIAPEYAYKIKYYSGHEDLFEKYDIDKQLRE